MLLQIYAHCVPDGPAAADYFLEILCHPSLSMVGTRSEVTELDLRKALFLTSYGLAKTQGRFLPQIFREWKIRLNADLGSACQECQTIHKC